MKHIKYFLGVAWYYCVHIFLFTLFGLFFRMKVEGKEKLPKKGGYIFTANHTSYLDPPIAGAISNRRLNYLAKEELFHVPVLGPIIRSLGAVPVSRNNRDTGSLKQSIAKLKQGEVVGIFPEGGRVRDGKVQQGQMGVAFIVKQTEVPVLPIGISGARGAFQWKGFFPRFKPIYVIIGDPIYYTKAENPKEEKENMRIFTDQLMKRIENLCREGEEKNAVRRKNK